MNDEKDMIVVPYIVHEGIMARSERTIRRLIIALIISILLIFASNILWLHAWAQYDYVGEETQLQTVDVDAKDGIANYIGNNGSISNGTDYGTQNDNETQSTETEQ